MLKEGEIFLKAMKLINGGKTAQSCPVCLNREFTFQGIFFMPTFALPAQHGGSAELGPEGLPVATATCTKCYYLLQFAWLPLRKMAENG